jgi:hypothetical protein
MRLRRRRVLLVALPLALVAGVALAAQPSARRPSNAVINACVKKRSGQVRVVRPGAGCRKNESRLSWNVRGPAGPRGAAGPTGATGATGPSGPVRPAGPPGRKASPEREAPPAPPARRATPARRGRPDRRSRRSRA